MQEVQEQKIYMHNVKEKSPRKRKKQTNIQEMQEQKIHMRNVKEKSPRNVVTKNKYFGSHVRTEPYEDRCSRFSQENTKGRRGSKTISLLEYEQKKKMGPEETTDRDRTTSNPSR